MIELTAGSHSVRYVDGGWSLCAMTSMWFARQIGHYRCLYCLIDWLTDVHHAGMYVDGTVCGNATFGAWRLWRHQFRHLFGPGSMHSDALSPSWPGHLSTWAITCHPTSASCLVQCMAANCRHSEVACGMWVAWAGRNTPAVSTWLSSRFPRQDVTRHVL